MWPNGLINMPHYKTNKISGSKGLEGVPPLSAGYSIPAWKRTIKSLISPPLRFSLWMDVNSSKGQSFKSPDIQAHVCVVLVAGREMILTTRPNTELPQAGLEPRTLLVFVVWHVYKTIRPHTKQSDLTALCVA